MFFYGRYDDLVNPCGKSVSQMTTDISRLSSQIQSFHLVTYQRI